MLPTDEPPNKSEIENALKFLKNNKSPGTDQITGEMLKAGEEITVDLLFKLFQKIWTEKTIPTEWKESLIVPIHKKGSKSQCGNYRGISLLSVDTKQSTLTYNL